MNGMKTLSAKRWIGMLPIPSILIIANFAHAGTYTWVGNDPSAANEAQRMNWARSPNWDLNNLYPGHASSGNQDTAVFGSTGYYSTTNGVGSVSNKTYGSIVFDGSPEFTIGTGTVNDSEFTLIGDANGIALSRTNATSTQQTIINRIILGAQNLALNINGTDGRLRLTGSLVDGPSISSNLTKTGNGTLQLSATNTFTGTFSVLDGTLQTIRIRVEGGTSGLGLGTTPVVLGGAETAGRLEYTGNSVVNEVEYLRGFTIGAGGGIFTNSSANPKVILKTGGITGAGSFTLEGTGPSTIVESPVSVAGAVIKTGTGSATLANANNTYAGETSILNGTLYVDGVHVGAANYTVDTAGTLAGVGVIQLAGAGNVITVNGILAPGNTATPIESLEIETGGLTLNGTANFDVDLSSAAADRITVGGLLVYGGTLNVAFTGDNIAGGEFDLLDFGSFSNAGALTFQYTGLAIGQTAAFDSATGIVTVSAVPEPAGTALAVFALAGIAGRRRRGF